MNLLLVVAAAVFAIGGTIATNTTCDGIACYDRGRPFRCEERGFFCCKGPSQDEWRATIRTMNHACCTGSGRTYNKATEVCDSGRIRAKGDSEEVCGSKTVYNTTSEKCCQLNEAYGRVYPKEEGECCNEINLLDRDLSCCKGIVFNVTLQTCCPAQGNIGYLLHDVPDGKCCQDLPYNPATQACLNDIRAVINKSQSDIKYCGNKPFNNATSICCSGKIGNRATQLCHTRRRPPILVDKQDPKDNAVCGDSERDYNTYYSGPNNRKVCISGQVLELEPNQDVCYTSRNGLKIYNTLSDLCCGGMKFHRNGLSKGLRCCPKRYKVYSPTSEICCSGKIRSDLSEAKGAKCCRDEAYNPKTHICYQGEVREKMCNVKDKPLYPQRCNLTSEHIEEIQRTFSNKGFYVYVVTATSPATSKGRWRFWDLENVTQVVAKNKKQLVRIMLNEKNDVKLKARTCTCPFELTPNKKYLIFSAKKMKKGIINIKAKEQGYNDKKDAIIPFDSGKLSDLIKATMLSAGKR